MSFYKPSLHNYNNTGVKKMCQGMHQAGIANIEITKEETHPVGEYIFKYGVADMLDKDNKVLDVTK